MFGVALNWEDLPNRSVVVDVGGGIGSTSMLLANAFKHLRFVVQDRDPVVEMGLEVGSPPFSTFFHLIDFFFRCGIRDVRRGSAQDKRRSRRTTS